jgi:hypothetical protein
MARNTEKAKKELVDGCLEVLRNLKCCEVEFHRPEAADYHDGLLRLLGPGGEVEYTVEIKQGLTKPTAAMLVHKLNALERKRLPALLFTDYVHQQLGEKLREDGVEFVDLAGNAYLNRPWLYVFVTGRKRIRAPERPTRAFQATGLKLIFLLLKNPDAVNWNYRDLAEAVDIALGGIGWIRGDLRELGFVKLVGRRQRRLTNRIDLFDRWVAGYGERLRPKLLQNRYRIAGDRQLDGLLDQIKTTANTDKTLIGGELGAALLLGTLRPERATLHLLGDPLKVITQLRLIPDPNGPVDVLTGFGTFNRWDKKQKMGCVLADPLLIYAELLLHYADRLKEIADQIFEGYIQIRLRENDQP